MKNILNEIIAHKVEEVALAKSKVTVAELEQSPLFSRPVFSLSDFILDPAKTGIITEFKRQSPSKGIINNRVSVEEVSQAYANHGASGISVLTDTQFFGGSLADLTAARFTEVPLLRKEFIIDEYQLLEARAHGADAILLIAACLSPQMVRNLAAFARSLQLEVLLELHDETELEHICPEVTLVGVNNRNLRNFDVDLEHSIRLAEQLGQQVKIAESGIRSAADIHYLKQHGFDGFLIGETFMKTANPGAAFAGLVQELEAVK